MSASTRSVLSAKSGGETCDNRSGPDGVSAPLPGPDPASLDTTEERRLMPSLPSAADNAQQPPESRIDGCPSCVLNAETPSSVYATRDGWLCNYVCQDCGEAWSTAWKD